VAQVPIQRWAEWVSPIASAMSQITGVVAHAPLALDAAQKARRDALLPTLQQWFNARGIVDENEKTVWRGLLAHWVRLTPPTTPAGVVMDLLSGVDFDRPAAVAELEDAQRDSALWNGAESARNGFGGPARPRRAQ